MGIKIPKIAFIKYSINDVTGIGLFLVKQICDQYNIDIKISSDCVKILTEFRVDNLWWNLFSKV